MRYEAPSILPLPSATDAIQSDQEKLIREVPDMANESSYGTSPAYEADE